MKAVLFDHDQFVLFENLPKPILEARMDGSVAHCDLTMYKKLMRRPTIHQMKSLGLINQAVEQLKEKYVTNQIDENLITIYERLKRKQEEIWSPTMNNIG